MPVRAGSFASLLPSDGWRFCQLAPFTGWHFCQLARREILNADGHLEPPAAFEGSAHPPTKMPALSISATPRAILRGARGGLEGWKSSLKGSKHKAAPSRLWTTRGGSWLVVMFHGVPWCCFGGLAAWPL